MIDTDGCISRRAVLALVKDIYVPTGNGVVNLTEREARVIEKFLNWACLDDNFCVESVEEYGADEWGKE